MVNSNVITSNPSNATVFDCQDSTSKPPAFFSSDRGEWNIVENNDEEGVKSTFHFSPMPISHLTLPRSSTIREPSLKDLTSLAPASDPQDVESFDISLISDHSSSSSLSTSSEGEMENDDYLPYHSSPTCPPMQRGGGFAQPTLQQWMEDADSEDDEEYFSTRRTPILIEIRVDEVREEFLDDSTLLSVPRPTPRQDIEMADEDDLHATLDYINSFPDNQPYMATSTCTTIVSRGSMSPMSFAPHRSLSLSRSRSSQRAQPPWMTSNASIECWDEHRSMSPLSFAPPPSPSSLQLARKLRRDKARM